MRFSIKLPGAPEISADMNKKNGLARAAVAAFVSIGVMIAFRFGLGL